MRYSVGKVVRIGEHYRNVSMGDAYSEGPAASRGLKTTEVDALSSLIHKERDSSGLNKICYSEFPVLKIYAKFLVM